MIVSAEKIDWQMTDQGLVVTTASNAPNKIAIRYRIETAHQVN